MRRQLARVLRGAGEHERSIINKLFVCVHKQNPGRDEPNIASTRLFKRRDRLVCTWTSVFDLSVEYTAAGESVHHKAG